MFETYAEELAAEKTLTLKLHNENTVLKAELKSARACTGCDEGSSYHPSESEALCGDCASSRIAGENSQRIAALEKELLKARAWTADDEKLPEDKAIMQAHPVNGGDDKRYAEALRLVSAKRSKYALVDLVNWLLSRIGALEKDKADLIDSVVALRQEIRDQDPSAKIVVKYLKEKP
jgi:hypothetical protein